MWGMHILIVEDDEVARDYLAKALREVGHTVDVAANGLDGLHMASSIAVDLAIVDRMLPKLAAGHGAQDAGADPKRLGRRR
jgi:DNA-binding response OmpR family regulator